MPANADLPRGCRLSNVQNQTGVAASVVFPASPGLSWVLDSFDAILTSQGGGITSFPTLQVLDGATVIWSNLMVVEGPAGAAVSQDERDLDPAALNSQAGNSLTIQFSAVAPASISQNITALAHAT